MVSLDEDTGCENFYILDLPIKKVKQTTIAFEDQAELGRLFDADVLVKDKNAAISRRDLGPSPRKCFICDRPAKECKMRWVIHLIFRFFNKNNRK